MCYFRTMAQIPTSWQELGARVEEARKVTRLSQAELAARMDLDRTVITKIEAGDRKVDSLELARLAEILKRPVDWFLSPPLPVIISRRKTRDADESQADVLLENLGRDVTQLFQMKLLKPSEPFQPSSIDSVASAETAARELRRHLKLPPGPIWDLLAVVERVGLYVFSLELEDESLDGSYLRLDKAGVAVVNGRAPLGRRRFTAVHELGHHIVSDDFSAEWIVGEREERESLINAFVIHFLLPRESLHSRWQELNGPNEPRWAAIALGAEYGLSWTAVLAHLCNLGLIDKKTRGRLETSSPKKADYVEAGITLKKDLEPPAISPGFARAVLRAYRKHKVGANRALELLRGTFTAAELPAEDQVPLEAMLSQLDLE